jgi:Uma2 family endonuclease
MMMDSRTLWESGMILQTPPSAKDLVITWEPLPDDFVLPDDPVENIQQPILAAALTDALGEAGLIKPEVLIASNFGLVATVNGRTIVKAPDWLYVPQVAPVPEGTVRRSYTQTLEGDPVAIVMEFLSDEDSSEYSVRPIYPYGKLYFYERILRVPTYVIFDPYSLDLEVWQLQDGRYILQAADEQGRFWIPALNLFLGVWYGSRLGSTLHWLRWWDAAGNLLFWSSEQVEQERQRAEAAEQELERLRSLVQQQQNQH